MLEPFANNHQSMQIGELIIENQQDKIIIYGDIDLHFNEAGHEQARQLHELTTKILQAFDNPVQRFDANDKSNINSISSDEMQVSKTKNDQPDENIDNPFL